MGRRKKSQDKQARAPQWRKTEKQAILYTTARINEASLKQVAMEKIDAVGKDLMWGNDDVK